MTTKDTKFFMAVKTADVLALDIFDAIGESMFESGITASAVSDAIKAAGDFSSVNVSINSPGGSLFDGVAIYNTLKACGKPVTVNIVGLAASAASLIAMAGDKVTMQLGTQLMIHRAMAISAGYSNDMRKMADTLDAVSASAADIYVAKTGMSKDAVLTLMEAETWMSPEEAVAQGFATSVSKDKAKVTNSFDLSVFKNTPVEFQVKTKEVDGENLTSEDFVWCGNPHDTSTWALPWKFSTEEKTQSHLRDALSRFDQEEKIPAASKPEAKAKLVRLCTEHGITVSEPTAAGPTASLNDVQLDIMQKRIELLKRRK
ncbi:MAG TPA: head maturation protease, ClpP-related [Terriglobales bacterium]|nr:head maturation protease, ClpP-related [Terriglobales bacterium]